MTAQLAHARLRSWKRSPHRQGRLTPENVLERDPARRTVCGAEPTDRDLSNRQARTKAGRPYLTCPDCAAALDAEATA